MFAPSFGGAENCGGIKAAKGAAEVGKRKREGAAAATLLRSLATDLAVDVDFEDDFELDVDVCA